MKLLIIFLFVCMQQSLSKCAPNKTLNLNDQELTEDDLIWGKNYDESQFFTGPLKKNDKKSRRTKRSVDSAEENPELSCFAPDSKYKRYINSFVKMILGENLSIEKDLNVTFHLKTRKSFKSVPIAYGDKFSLKNKNFNIRRRTVFIVHGFKSSKVEPWIEDLAAALLKWSDVNIFIVDWTDAANTWNYYRAAQYTQNVGRQMAMFINQIVDYQQKTGTRATRKFGKLHIVGHSLGAHISGRAADELKRIKSIWQVHRITGLDPAQPCFRFSHPKLRLDKYDAKFVDVIHTNGGVLRRLGLGLPYPIGHTDFYPNGGSKQPGCKKDSRSWIKRFFFSDFIDSLICNHGRAYLYLTESVIAASEGNCTFWAHSWDMNYVQVEKILPQRCKSYFGNYGCIEMGINAENYNYYGTYLSITGGAPPYCKATVKDIEEVKTDMDKILEGNSNETAPVVKQLTREKATPAVMQLKKKTIASYN